MISFTAVWCCTTCNNPVRALENLVEHLTAGGILACEEPPISEGSFALPASKALAVINTLAISLFHKNKIKYDVAYKLSILLKEAGLTITNYNVFQPFLNSVERNLPIMGLEEIKGTFIKEKILTQEVVPVTNKLKKRDRLCQ